MHAPPDQKKAESRANAIQPIDHETRKGNEVTKTMAQRGESVKHELTELVGCLREDLKTIAAYLGREGDGHRELAHRRAIRALRRIGDESGGVLQ